METPIRVEADVAFRVFQGPSGAYVAVCEPLGITLGGDTWSEMLDTIQDGVKLLLEDLVESGDLDRFLRTRGWHLRGELPRDARRFEIDLPYEVVRDAGLHPA
jgi:predicted RNase H-like HicB family nuclease